MRTVEIARAYRRLFDRVVPGWRNNYRPSPDKPLARAVAVVEVVGVPGQREAVLYVRGGLDGEALPGEVVEFDPATLLE